MKKNFTGKTCCFTGHRPDKLPPEDSPEALSLQKTLREEIETLCKAGCLRYISGMAMGVDIICAEIVLELKPEYGCALTAALPFAQQSMRWPDFWKKRHARILADCDETVNVSEEYSRGCMHRRNAYMVNQSDLLLAVYNGSSGGTKFTVDRAISKKMDIIKLSTDGLSVEYISFETRQV